VLPTARGDGEAGVFTLQTGDCLNDAAETGDVTMVPVIDCTKPHDSEIYASAVMDDGKYPGLDPTREFAKTTCAAQFETFVGLSDEQSIYTFATLYPTPASWAGGDREVLCRIALVDANGDVVRVKGSLKGIDK
jgi:hypothetical protein